MTTWPSVGTDGQILLATFVAIWFSDGRDAGAAIVSQRRQTLDILNAAAGTHVYER